MKMVTLGKTGITVPQNAFGALPIQRVDMETARQILHRAYEGGISSIRPELTVTVRKNSEMHLKECVRRFLSPARPWVALPKISKNN